MNIALKNHFSILLSDTIWRMDINEDQSLIAVETRDQSSGQPKFSVFSYATGDILLFEHPYGDRWWTLAGIGKTHLFLHLYTNPSKPNTHAVVALNITDGQVSWEHFNMQFQELSEKGIMVNKPFLPNGNVALLAEDTGEEIIGKVNILDIAPIKRNIITPLITEAIPPINRYQKNTVGPFFFLQYKNIDFWCFHEERKEYFTLRLIAFQDLTPLFNLVLDDKLKQLNPEPFFIVDQQIFYITNNKREIVSYFV